MPKAETLSSAVETAQKCAFTASSPSADTSQRRAVCALVIVSMVVKVLDAMMKRVRFGSSPFSVSAMCAPSTFETKCARGPSW